MNFNLAPLLLLACGFLTLFAFAEFLYHKKKVRAELTRKIVHIGTGLLTLLFPIFLYNHWQVLLLCGSFLIILLASLQFKILPSINAVDRESYGSILYPVAVYGCYLVYVFAQKGLIMFYLPILSLAICDPLAEIFGKRFPYGKYRFGKSTKTFSGSLAFFISCTVLSIFSFYFHAPAGFHLVHVLPISVLIAAIAAVTEAICRYGTDNITIPASVIVTLGLIL